MSKKVTKEKFIQTIENNEDDLTNYELSAQLGISESYFYDLRSKYRVMIKNRASEIAKYLALEQVNNLARNARNGDSQAAKILLEIAWRVHAGKQTEARN